LYIALNPPQGAAENPEQSRHNFKPLIMQIFNMPPEINKGFKELKSLTGLKLERLYLVALHKGLMQLKKETKNSKSINYAKPSDANQ
jgi:hypothetical protein